MDNYELKIMIRDYMNKGFLDNILDMFKHDEGLFPLIIDMIKDDRVRVKLGTTALVEELVKLHREPLIKQIPDLAELLKDEAPNVRGDAANLLGIIRHEDALPFLLIAEHDDNHSVREVIREAIREIQAVS